MKYLALLAVLVLPALAAHAQAPAAGSIAVQVKNVGDGSTTVWLGPGSPPVLQGIAAGGTPTLFSLGSSITVSEGALVVAPAWSSITGKPTTLAGYGITDGLTAATAASTYVSLTGSYADPAWVTSLAWSKITGEPTTLAGYGITDGLTAATAASTYVALGGSYADPAWITSLAWSKITGAPSFLTANQTITLSGDFTGSGTTSIVGTLANSGVVADSYSPAQVTVDAKGRVTAAASVPVNTDNGSSGGALVAMELDPNSGARFGIPFFHNPNYPDPADPAVQTAWLVAGAGTDQRRIILPAVDGTLLTTTGNGGSLTNLDPHALQQRGATDGQVLTWSTANSRWQPASVGGAGTVTSVAIAGTDGIEVDSGSPITGAGTITLGVNAATLKTTLNLTGTNSGDVTLGGTLDYLTLAGQVLTLGAIDLATDTTGSLAWASVSKTGSSLADLATRSAADLTNVPVEIGVACSDETTDLTTGDGKVTFRLPHAMTLTAVRASVTTAPTGSTIIIDIKEGGTSVLGTLLSIDASEKTSTTAASAATITDSALSNDAEITIDLDQIGSSTAGKGLKIWLIGTRN